MDLEFLKSLISDFDLMAILPDMALVMEWIVKGVYYTIMAGPALLVFMGLWYLILPPREANHFLGYRFYWGMGSDRSWRFTQRFAGMVWALLGYRLGSDMYNNHAGLQEMETLEMLYLAIDLILDQIFAVFISTLVINTIIFLLFNFKGNVRWLWRWIWKQIKKLFHMLFKRDKEAPTEEAP